MNPLIVLGGLAALYYLFTGEFNEQNSADEDRGGDGNHHRSELSPTSANGDGGKGGVTPDPEPTTDPAQE